MWVFTPPSPDPNPETRRWARLRVGPPDAATRWWGMSGANGDLPGRLGSDRENATSSPEMRNQARTPQGDDNSTLPMQISKVVGLSSVQPFLREQNPNGGLSASHQVRQSSQQELEWRPNARSPTARRAECRGSTQHLGPYRGLLCNSIVRDKNLVASHARSFGQHSRGDEVFHSMLMQSATVEVESKSSCWPWLRFCGGRCHCCIYSIPPAFDMSRCWGPTRRSIDETEQVKPRTKKHVIMDLDWN